VRAGLYKILAAGFILTAIQSAGLFAQDLASPGASAQVTFAFEHSGLPVPMFTLALGEDGAGTYKAEEGTEDFDRSFTVTAATAAKIFTLVRHVSLKPEVCASKAKNIADTGTKTLSYVAGATSANCTYNYSENKDVQQLTALFQGIAETMDEGRTLERLHRYDRLGLDAEMSSFADEVSAGRALELGTIAPCLRAIADDPQVIQRVRTRAAKFLALNPPVAAAS
jgi:hypothetical protein